MKPRLLFPDRDLDVQAPAVWNADALIADLDLAPVLDAMGHGDPHLRQIAERVLLAGLTDPTLVRYRQAVLTDWLAHPDLLHVLYRLTVDTLEGERKLHHFAFSSSARAVLQRGVDSLDFFTGRLAALRAFADQHADTFSSAGLTNLMGTLTRELDDAYLAEVTGHLTRLRFPAGIMVAARLGPGNQGSGYQLRTPPGPRTWWQRLADRHLPPPSQTLVIPDRDEGGARALTELTNRGLRPIAEALAQSVDHILAFHHALRDELAFYLGCVNLYQDLRARQVVVCFPDPGPAEPVDLAADGLTEVALALRSGRTPVPSSVPDPAGGLIVITGPNQGGKTTFLRAVGQALLMQGCGMFVAAERFRGSLPTGLATLFRREEDPTMTGGKFDEELGRIRLIADRLRAGGTLLANEPFAGTNEREGSELGRQIVRALTESGIRVVLVTHLYQLARQLTEEPPVPAVFLRADRRADGARTHRILPGPPEATSHGVDLYDQVFGPRADLLVPAAAPLTTPTGTPSSPITASSAGHQPTRIAADVRGQPNGAAS